MMSDTVMESIATLGDSTCNTLTPGQLIEVATREELPFHHVKIIGKGGSAVIELVLHKLTKQPFALKTVRCVNSGQFEEVKRAFKNEVGITERLSSHAHIIQVLGTYTYDRDLSMLLSPVANGGDLAAYFARIFESKMTYEDEVILNRAFGCLANGLRHIHKHTIRHKDIKPQNILIHNGRVIYTDFGLSFDADQQDTTTTGYPGHFTRRYCAPEVQDWADRNRKSDVFSLGCVFVEILDVLEPNIGLRCSDRLPYFEKLDEVRRRLVQTSATGKARKGLLRICHDMLEPDPVGRIDTGSVFRRISRLDSSNDKPEIGLFCDDCSDIAACKDIETQEELVDDFTALSLNANPNADVVSPEAEIKSTAPKTAKKRKSKKTVSSKEFRKKEPTVSQGSFYSKVSRYYCTSCGELGHNSSECPNECWACGDLYHKSANCPNKCWTCDQVGHQAKNCPNECDACGKIGHPKDDCPNSCWTCGEVGHFARDCQDPCFVCGRLGHGTQKCMGKCHKCGKIGHWKKDCDDACFECGELGHWAAKCPSKRKKGKRGDACYECGQYDHRVAQCPEKRRGVATNIRPSSSRFISAKVSQSEIMAWCSPKLLMPSR